MSDIAPADNVASDAKLVSTPVGCTPSDADLVATLGAEVDELNLLVADLELSRPSTLLSFCTLILALLSLGVVLALIAAPAIVPGASTSLPTIAAFLAVVLTYFTYAAYKRFVVDIERRRRHSATLARAKHLLDLAIDVMRDATASSIESRAN